ncbi:MAG: hypothetical protein QOD77_898 [Thermoplasmata archaeon]|jgi:plastocyanin|nr:hypothetical protein [Thermoplasmata archaeon]
MKVLLASLAVALLLSGCMANDGNKSTSTTPTTGAQDADEVALRDNMFDPTTLDVAKGTLVRFDNEGARRHTVTIHWVGDPIEVTKLNQTVEVGSDTSFTFATAGTYHVWCRFHGTMTSGMAMVVKAT